MMGVLTEASNAEELACGDGPSLQDAFAKFRSRRAKQKRTVPASELKALAAARRALDPAGDGPAPTTSAFSSSSSSSSD